MDGKEKRTSQLLLLFFLLNLLLKAIVCVVGDTIVNYISNRYGFHRIATHVLSNYPAYTLIFGTCVCLV